MRITVNNVVLCEGQAKDEYPEQFAIDSQRVVQIAQYLRADNAEPIGRGNRIRRITFRVTREHASHRVACEWAVAHEVSIPQAGTVLIMFEDTGTSKYYLHHGEVETVRCDPIIGCTTIHSYNLVGSLLSKEVPE